jgi:Ca2+-binding RTX toxin-like protein
LRQPDGQWKFISIGEVLGFGGGLVVRTTTLANGNAVVVWAKGEALNARIVTPEGETLGGKLTLHQQTSSSLEQLAVEALPEGGFAVAFVNRSIEQGVGTDVYLGIYSADGHVVEAPSVVGRATDGLQEAPDIAVLKDGRYVVSWRDFQDNLTHFQAYDPRTKGVSVSGDEANDRFTGSRFDDAFDGGGGADRLLGEDGNDVLNGGLGGDLMFGGSGNDIYYVDSVDDRIVEWVDSGVDHVIAEISQDLWDEVENLTASGTGAITLNGNELSNRITGNASQNVLSGKAGSDILNGGAGADQMIGGMGDDTLHVDDAGDQVVEAQGGGRDTVYTNVNFTLSASQEIEILTAVGGAGITLKGNYLANAVIGSSGANKLWGGLGNDQLTGGSGKDIFVFDTKAHKSKNKDSVADFKVADDTIWLDNKVFTKLGKKGTEKKPAKLDKGFLVVGSKAKDKNDYVVYDKKKGVLLYDADGSGKGKAVEVATLSKNLKMTEKDFFVI